MKKMLVAGCVTTFLLVGCGGSTGSPQRITSARQALIYAGQLMRTGKVSPDVFRPSALLGVHVSLFLGKTAEAAVSTALRGVEIQQELLLEGREHVSEAFRVLTALSDTLGVDIPDMLNRSSDRQEALDTYVTTLEALFEQAKVQAVVLEQEQDVREDEARARRSAASAIQRDLNRARSDKDYATVSQKQEQLIAAQTEEAQADAKVREVRTTLNVMEELIEVAGERLVAVAENREILLAGLQVVEVPGVEDLDILIERNGNSFRNNNLFGEPL